MCDLAGTSVWVKGATTITKRTDAHLSQRLKLFREEALTGRRSTEEDGGRLRQRLLIKGAQQDSQHHGAVVGGRQSIPENTIGGVRAWSARGRTTDRLLWAALLSTARRPSGTSSPITARLPMSGKRRSGPISPVLNIPAMRQ